MAPFSATVFALAQPRLAVPSGQAVDPDSRHGALASTDRTEVCSLGLRAPIVYKNNKASTLAK